MSLSGGQLSGGNTATKRVTNDFYATDPKAVEKLFDSFDRDGVEYPSGGYCLEPCVGNGNIVSEFDRKAYFLNRTVWTCIDIVNRGYPHTIVHDFLTWQTDKKYHFIISNPPFSLASEFIEKSIDLLLPECMCCMFLKLQFLEGTKRKELFDKHPPKYIYVFRNRMATWKDGKPLNPKTGKKWAETICFAWFVWIKGVKDEPVIRWID